MIVQRSMFCRSSLHFEDVVALPHYRPPGFPLLEQQVCIYNVTQFSMLYYLCLHAVVCSSNHDLGTTLTSLHVSCMHTSQFSCFAWHSFLHHLASYTNLPAVTKFNASPMLWLFTGCGIGNLRMQDCPFPHARTQGCMILTISKL